MIQKDNLADFYCLLFLSFMLLLGQDKKRVFHISTLFSFSFWAMELLKPIHQLFKLFYLVVWVCGLYF